MDKSMPKVEEVKVEEIKKVEKVTVTKSRKQKILDDHGGLESNIPINSAYWRLKF
jgi:hypothetical protein